MDPQVQAELDRLQRQIDEMRLAPVLDPNLDPQTLAVINNKLDLTPGLSFGDIVYISSTGEYKRLPPDANKYLKSLGAAAPAWALIDLANGVSGNLGVSHLNGGSGALASTYWRGDGSWAAITVPTIKLHVTASTVTVQNTTTETNIYTLTVPANTLSTNNAIKSRTLGGGSTTITFNNGTDTLTIQGYYGASSFSFPLVITGSNTGAYAVEIDFWIIASGATNSQVGIMKAHLWDQSAGFANNVRQTLPIAYQIFAVDSTAAQTMKLTATWSASSSNDRAIFDASIVDLTS